MSSVVSPYAAEAQAYLKAKAEKEQRRAQYKSGEFRKNQWYQSTKDNAVLRILPPVDLNKVDASPKKPWSKKYAMHWRIAPTSKVRHYTCPKESKNLACPICEHRVKLDTPENKKNKSIQKLIFRLRPEPMYVTNILDMEDVAKGVQLFSFKEELYAQLNVFLANSTDWGDFMHPQFGKNVMLTKIHAGKKDVLVANLSQTPSSVDPRYLSELYDLDEVNRCSSYEELKVVLEGFLQNVGGILGEDPSNNDDIPLNVGTTTGQPSVTTATQVAAMTTVNTPATTANPVTASPMIANIPTATPLVTNTGADELEKLLNS